MSPIEVGILRCLAFSELFEFPLKFSEIRRYYQGEVRAGPPEITAALGSLSRQGIVQSDPSQEYYFFPGQQLTVAKRRRSEAESIAPLLQARRLSHYLSLIPWIKLVGVTGSLSRLNSRPDDDTDLLLITGRRRLWLSRFVIFSALKILGLKGGAGQGRRRVGFCINVWMSENDLAVGEAERDLVIAHDLISLRVLWDRGGCQAALYAANRWLDKFFPNWEERPEASEGGRRRSLGAGFLFLISPIFDLLDRLLYWFQVSIISRNYPGSPFIRMSRSRLWQHPTNSRGRILSRFAQGLSQRLGQTVLTSSEALI